MRILVTGGAGFIGSNFVRHVLSKHTDYKVINLDKLTYAGNLDNLKDVKDNPTYRFVEGDICDEKIVTNLTKDCNAIINFAAETHVDRSILGPKSFIKTDILGTHTLLEAARKQGIRLLQVSTDEVYGSIENGSFTEESPLNPSSPYSASKAAADMLCNSYFTTYGTDIVITRSSNNFGPYQYPEKLIPLFITNLVENKKVPLYGDGLNVRDWLYVVDNCSAIDLILHKGKSGQVYNVGSGHTVCQRQARS
jgi:dTDP-glucose 4,6-dehydratase